MENNAGENIMRFFVNRENSGFFFSNLYYYSLFCQVICSAATPSRADGTKGNARPFYLENVSDLWPLELRGSRRRDFMEGFSDRIYPTFNRVYDRRDERKTEH